MGTVDFLDSRRPQVREVECQAPVSMNGQLWRDVVDPRTQACAVGIHQDAAGGPELSRFERAKLGVDVRSNDSTIVPGL
jgi:hypothetical protein